MRRLKGEGIKSSQSWSKKKKNSEEDAGEKISCVPPSIVAK